MNILFVTSSRQSWMLDDVCIVVRFCAMHALPVLADERLHVLLDIGIVALSVCCTLCYHCVIIVVVLQSESALTHTPTRGRLVEVHFVCLCVMCH